MEEHRTYFSNRSKCVLMDEMQRMKRERKRALLLHLDVSNQKDIILFTKKERLVTNLIYRRDQAL